MAVGISVRAVVIAFVYRDFLEPGRDHWEFGYEMGRIARSIATGHGFGNPYWAQTGPTALITPIYPYMMAGIFSVFGIQTKSAAFAVLGLNSLFSVLTCIPIFFIAKKTVGIRGAQWSAWAWALFPYAINFSADSMWYHSLVALLVTVLFWLALVLRDSDRILPMGVFGLLAGVAVLTSPATLAIVPFMMAWVVWQNKAPLRRWLYSVSVASLLFLALIAPWLVRNYRTFHRPVFLKDNFWLEFCIGNVGNSRHWWNGDVHPAGSVAEMNEFERVGEIAYMAENKDRAIAYIESHPRTVLLRSLRRFVFIWTGFWSFRSDYLREEPLDPLNVFMCTTVTIFAFMGIWKMLRADAGIAALYILLLAIFPVVYYITHPDLAYREPIDPEIVILACLGILSWQPARFRVGERRVVEDLATPAIE